MNRKSSDHDLQVTLRFSGVNGYLQELPRNEVRLDLHRLAVQQGSWTSIARLFNLSRPHGFACEFEKPWEIVPGEWVLSIVHGDRLLARRSFQVFLPRLQVCRKNLP